MLPPFATQPTFVSILPRMSNFADLGHASAAFQCVAPFSCQVNPQKCGDLMSGRLKVTLPVAKAAAGTKSKGEKRSRKGKVRWGPGGMRRKEGDGLCWALGGGGMEGAGTKSKGEK